MLKVEPSTIERGQHPVGTLRDVRFIGVLQSVQFGPEPLVIDVGSSAAVVHELPPMIILLNYAQNDRL